MDIILGDVAACNEDLERSSKLIKQLQINCQEKSVGLAKLQEVHDNRLERMSNLQEHLRWEQDLKFLWQSHNFSCFWATVKIITVLKTNNYENQ